jgi:hypothetical protein
VKALSIQQPWAWLIVNGYKDIENRSWHTKYRGPIAVHASLRFDDFGYMIVKRDFPHISLPEKRDFERGGLVGTTEIVDCVDTHDSRWFTGSKSIGWGFVLRNSQAIPFKPCKGKLGLFEVTP